MKSLSISLLLLAPSLICLVHGTSYPRAICLQGINNARGEYAKALHVANMNELSYDKKLEKNILEHLSFTDGCPQPEIITHRGSDIYLNFGDQSSFIDLLSGVGSTKMACVLSTCEKTRKEFFSIATDHSDSAVISGSPGSQCLNNRSVSSNGLCTLESSLDGYRRKIFGKIWNAMKDAAEKTGEVAIEKTKDAAKTTTAIEEGLSKTLTKPETKVVKEVHEVSGFKKSIWDTLNKAAEQMNLKSEEIANEIMRSERKYARKGSYGRPPHRPSVQSFNRFGSIAPFVNYPKYHKKESDDVYIFEKPELVNHPPIEPIWN